jgi:cyanophycinase
MKVLNLNSMRILVFSLVIYFGYPLQAQISPKSRAVQIITSGGKTADSLFTSIIGHDARLIFIPSAASSLRSDEGTIWNPGEEVNKNQFTEDLKKRFGVNNIIILHTRDSKEADTKDFCLPLKQATAVWISGGNAGRFMKIFRGTRLEKELKTFLDNGGIIGGESAGAIVQGSYTIRGNPDKPVLMVEGSEKGLGFLKNTAINPHLSAAKRENELVTVVDKYPELLGIGIDDNTGLLIRNGVAEVFGAGRVAIYDNSKHKNGWYYWLKPGNQFNLRERKAMNFIPE